MKQNKGNLEESEAKIREVLDDIVWMAIRYAHGRHTTAPSTVRSAVKKIKEIYPDFDLGKDKTIKPPTESELKGIGFRDDYLDDLYSDVTP
jgi:hypothetical protein